VPLHSTVARALEALRIVCFVRAGKERPAAQDVGAMPLIQINQVFEKVLVLNLDRRPDRMAAIEAQLRGFGIDFERFDAIDGQRPEIARQWQAYARQPFVRLPAGHRPVTSYREFYLDYDSDRARVTFFEETYQRKALATPGAWGLLLSMTAIVERALDECWESLLVFEDDVLFHKETTTLFDRFVAQAPPHWLVLQLGAMQLHWESDWISWHSSNLYRCRGSSIGAHAYGIRREAFALLREHCHARSLPFDLGALHTVKRRYADRCFTMMPNLAIQDAADSDIGMSTIFFQQARKTTNVYRWHLPDYGPQAQHAARDGETAAEPVNGEGTGFKVRDQISRLMTSIATRLDRTRRQVLPPEPAGPSAAGAPEQGAAAKARQRGLRPLQPFADAYPEARTIAIVLVGLQRAELEKVIGMVDGIGIQRGLVPVVVTDCDAFELFRGRRIVTEYLPPEAHRSRFAADLDWDLYRLRRLALLRRKWQPARIVAFGLEASALVRDWAASPFEDPTIKEVISAPATAALAGDTGQG
jgi:GR25 family glycosyltransferase involved in LPS biosynthesis